MIFNTSRLENVCGEIKRPGSPNDQAVSRGRFRFSTNQKPLYFSGDDQKIPSSEHCNLFDFIFCQTMILPLYCISKNSFFQTI